MSDNRKTGENFDKNEAADIFEKLKNVEGKIKPKRESKLKNISNLMSEANYLKDRGDFTQAISIFEQIIFTLPDSQKAYESLIDIYQKQGNSAKEKETLIKAISNCKNNKEFKNRLKELG